MGGSQSPGVPICLRNHTVSLFSHCVFPLTTSRGAYSSVGPGSSLQGSCSIPGHHSPPGPRVGLNRLLFGQWWVITVFILMKGPDQAECVWLFPGTPGRCGPELPRRRKNDFAGGGLSVIRTTRPAAALPCPYRSRRPSWILLIAECCWVWQIQEAVYMATQCPGSQSL